MKKIFTMMVCLAAMLMSVSAHAAYSYNVTAGPAGGGASNFWSVLFSTNDYQTWTVVAKPSASAPNGSPNQLNFAVRPGTANSTSGIVNLGGQTDLAIGNIAWDISGGSNAGFTSPDTANNLQPAGLAGSGSTFTGSFKLASVVKVGSLKATLTDDTFTPSRTWSGTSSFTPEMPGGVLLLAAFLPMGLMLRKKGAFQKNAL